METVGAKQINREAPEGEGIEHIIIGGGRYQKRTVVGLVLEST